MGEKGIKKGSRCQKMGYTEIVMKNKRSKTKKAKNRKPKQRRNFTGATKDQFGSALKVLSRLK